MCACFPLFCMLPFSAQTTIGRGKVVEQTTTGGKGVMYIWVDDHHTHTQIHKKKESHFLAHVVPHSLYVCALHSSTMLRRKFSCHAAAIPLFRPMSTIEQSTHSTAACQLAVPCFDSTHRPRSSLLLLMWSDMPVCIAFFPCLPVRISPQSCRTW